MLLSSWQNPNSNQNVYSHLTVTSIKCVVCNELFTSQCHIYTLKYSLNGRVLHIGTALYYRWYFPVGETYLWLIRLYVSTELFQFPTVGRRFPLGTPPAAKTEPQWAKKSRVAPRKVVRGLYWLSTILVKYIPNSFLLNKKNFLIQW